MKKLWPEVQGAAFLCGLESDCYYKQSHSKIEGKGPSDVFSGTACGLVREINRFIISVQAATVIKHSGWWEHPDSTRRLMGQRHPRNLLDTRRITKADIWRRGYK